MFSVFFPIYFPSHIPEEGKTGEAATFVDMGFLAETYRAMYSDVAHSVVPPIPSLLDKDLSLLPPADVEGQSGRPRKGPRKRARIQSNGEFNSSAKFSQRVENLTGTANGAAGAANWATGVSQGGLSQDGLSQGSALDVS